MRVIAGSVKGLRLKAPSTQKVRPVADKVKGAIFNILGDISGTRVLDLFAGSGSVGIEALSREASFCVFVEADKNIASYLQKNLEHCCLEKKAKLLVQKVSRAIPWLEKKGQTFDLIFVDPPYDKNLLNPTLELLCQHPSLLSPHSLLVIEHSPRELPKQAIAVEGEAPSAPIDSFSLAQGPEPVEGLPVEGATRAPVIEEMLEIIDSRKYGQTFISLMKLAPSPPDSKNG